MEYKFKKFGGDIIPDLGLYLKGYLSKYPNTTIFVGSDSDNLGGENQCVTVIGLYDEERKDGVHFIFTKVFRPMQKNMFQKMWNEVEQSIEVANYLEIELEGYAKRFSADELKMKKQADGRTFFSAHQDRLVNIDVDINPIHGPGGRNKSNIAYDAAKSYLTGLGYRVRFKPYAWAASCAADMMIGSGKKKRKNKKSLKKRRAQ